MNRVAPPAGVEPAHPRLTAGCSPVKPRRNSEHCQVVLEPLVGIEPPSLLTRQVPSQMATRGILVCIVHSAVPVQGFEPQSSASKTAILPLDDTGFAMLAPRSSATSRPALREGYGADYGICTRTLGVETRDAAVTPSPLESYWGDRGESNSHHSGHNQVLCL